jgi:hypothetical protein
MAELHWTSASDLASMIQRRELKPSELTAASIARVESLNPKLNAFCALRAEEAMAEARALDEKIARGEGVGLLVGLPLGVKDLEAVAGLATTFGSLPFKEHRETRFDSGRTSQSGGRDRDRQDQYTRIWFHGVHEKSPLRRYAKSVEPRAHARRFVGRQFGRNRLGDGTTRDRVGLGRLYSHPGMLHRSVRT